MDIKTTDIKNSNGVSPLSSQLVFGKSPVKYSIILSLLSIKKVSHKSDTFVNFLTNTLLTQAIYWYKL